MGILRAGGTIDIFVNKSGSERFYETALKLGFLMNLKIRDCKEMNEFG